MVQATRVLRKRKDRDWFGQHGERVWMAAQRQTKRGERLFRSKRLSQQYRLDSKELLKILTVCVFTNQNNQCSYEVTLLRDETRLRATSVPSLRN